MRRSRARTSNQITHYYTTPHDTHTDRTQRHCWRESSSMHASQGRLSSRDTVSRVCRAPGLDISASRRPAKRSAVQPWMTIILLVAEISLSTCQSSNCVTGKYGGSVRLKGCRSDGCCRLEVLYSGSWEQFVMIIGGSQTQE